MSEQSESSNVPRFELRHRMDLAMESAGLKAEDMAAEIGRSVTTIRNYLAGRTTPTRAVVTAWALRCKVDRDWLAYGIEADPDSGPGQEIRPIGCIDGRPGKLLAFPTTVAA